MEYPMWASNSADDPTFDHLMHPSESIKPTVEDDEDYCSICHEVHREYVPMTDEQVRKIESYLPMRFRTLENPPEASQR